jgi:hypothetical protein
LSSHAPHIETLHAHDIRYILTRPPPVKGHAIGQ